MRRLALWLLSAGALVSFVASADAAAKKRKIVKAPPPVAKPVTNLPSFYVGGHLGYGWSKFAPSDDTPSVSPRGALGGAQVGANYQFDRFVVGVEGDFSLASVLGSNSGTAGGTPVNVHARHLWFATVAGRIGYAYERWLVYGTAGGAATSYKLSIDAPGVGSGSASGTRYGWLVGGGVEQAFTDRISARLEYNYMDFGTRDETFTTTGPFTATAADVRLYAHVVKLALNYRLSPMR
jgi:outer membrane immunogenic protein